MPVTRFNSNGFATFELIALSMAFCMAIYAFVNIQTASARARHVSDTERAYYQLKEELAGALRDNVHTWVNDLAVPPAGTVGVACSTDVGGTPFPFTAATLPSLIQLQLLNDASYGAQHTLLDSAATANLAFGEGLTRCRNQPIIYPPPSGGAVTQTLRTNSNYYFCFILNLPASGAASGPTAATVLRSQPILIEASYQSMQYDATLNPPIFAGPLTCDEVTNAPDRKAVIGRITYTVYWSGTHRTETLLVN